MASVFVVGEDTLTPILNRVVRKLSPQSAHGFVLAWGAGVASQARRNAHAKGGRNFWRDLARSVSVRAIAQEHVEIASDHVAAAQKQYGGAIEAPGKGAGSRNARALTIPIPGSPADTSAHPTAREFALSGLSLFVAGRTLGYADKLGTYIPLFVLVKRTRPQRPEPWFPSESDVSEFGAELAEKALEL